MSYIPAHPPSLRERFAVWQLVERDEQYREAIRQRCADDAAFFINTFCFTFDPRPTAEFSDMAFIMYPFQERTVRWLDERLADLEDGIIEKSRDMGVTWVFLSWLLHGWLFKPGFQALVGSRKEDLVDNGAMDSHFGKLEYLVDKLPGWLVPARFRMSEHRTKLKLRNPSNGNLIIGESANAQFSRQGRYTVIIFDEAAFVEELESGWRAAAQATTCRIAISTPNAMNAFGRMRHATREDTAPMYKVLTLHAREHPHKGDEWVERQRGRMSVEDFAQEIDISYSRSSRGAVYPEFRTIPSGYYPYKQGWPLWVSWDFGVRDDTALIWWTRNPDTGKFRMVDSYANRDKAIDFYLPLVKPELLGRLGRIHDYDDADLQRIGRHGLWPAPIHFGDPAGNQRAATTGTSVIDELRKEHIYVFTNDRARDFRTRKGATELGLREIEGINDPDCASVREALLNAKFPERNLDSKSTAESVLPIHDWTEAYRTAVEYFFVNVPPLHRTKRPEPDVPNHKYDNLRNRRRR